VNGIISPLANFGSVTFSNCSAVINSISVGIGVLPTDKLLLFSSPMSSSSIQLADVIDPSAYGSEFVVTYLEVSSGS